MKKISVYFLFLVLVISFSCKKERNCNCTITESGTRTVRNQQAAVSLTVVPGIPAVTISPAQDATSTNPYFVERKEVRKYEKISNSTYKQVCNASSEQAVNETSILSSGSTTVTTTEVGSVKTACKIE